MDVTTGLNYSFNKVAMIKYSINILVGIIFVLFPTIASAETFVYYDIAEDTTWVASSSPYVISNSINILGGSTLTIESDVVIKFLPYKFISVYGTINANGTSGEEIYFTSYKDDIGGDTNGDGNASLPAPADWRKIHVFDTGVLNLSNTVVRYGGNGICHWSDQTCKGAFYIDGGEVFIEHSTISNNWFSGIYQKSGTVVINNSEITNNRVNASIASGSFFMSSSTMSDAYSGSMSVAAGVTLELHNNVFSPNGGNIGIHADTEFTHSNNVGLGFYISGTLGRDSTWTSGSMPYIVQSGITVPNDKTLTIEAGTVIKFGSYAGMAVGGTLNVQGEEDNKVYFTSIKDDDVGGDANNDGNLTLPSSKDWRQIRLGNGAIANIDHAVIRYGGDNVCGYHTYCKGGLYNSYGDLYVNNSQISNNGSYGIYHAFGNSTLIENSEVFQNNIGLYINSGVVSINNSSIHDNSAGVLNGYNNLTIDATNNWWGDVSGPTHSLNPGGTGDLIHYNNVLFEPWLGSDPANVNIIDPVIIIPGILGSWEKNGEWVIDPVLHTYDDLIETLVLNGYEDGIDLFTFPYDWKSSNVETALLLDQKIEEIKTICECEKVDLVAHSMGGLVSRQYIQSNDYDDDVDQLIFLGTPHLGSAKSYLMWEGGELGINRKDLALRFIYTRDAEKNGYDDLFDYVRNKPIVSIQQLLPTVDYLMEYESSVMRTYSNGYHRNGFLEELNQNVSSLLNSGVDITNIIGSGNNTIEKIKVVESNYLPKWEHGYPVGYYDKEGDLGLEYGDGDETVTMLSSSFINTDLNKLNSAHISLPKNGQSLVFEKLTGVQPDQLSDKFNVINFKLLIIKILSPVDVQVVAPDGERIGKNFDTGSEINEIDGAFYSGFETNNEYVTIINPLDGDYSVITQGTDDGGKYTVAVGLVSDDGLVENDFVSYTLPNSVEEISITLDQSANGGVDIVEETDISLDDLILHINQAYSLGWITNSKFKSKLIKVINKGIKEEQKTFMSRSGAEKKSVKRFNEIEDVFQDDRFALLIQKKNNKKIRKVLEKEFLKKLDSGLKSRKINEEGYNLLKEDVLLLINNL